MSGMAEVLGSKIFAGRQLNEPQIEEIVAALTAAGFGPVKGEKRLMELAAVMAYDAVEEGALREAGAVALEEAADAIEPRVMQFFKAAQDLNDPHRAWLRARAAAIRGES